MCVVCFCFVCVCVCGGGGGGGGVPIHCISSFITDTAFIISLASLSLVSKRFRIKMMKRYATLKGTQSAMEPR